MFHSRARFLAALATASLALPSGGCSHSPPDDTGPPATQAIVFDPPAPALRRLTRAEYVNSIHDVFGDQVVVVPGALEPDSAVGGFLEVGASDTSISERGVEQYETAAYDIAGQVMKDDTARKALVPCTPAGADDAACAGQVIDALGPRLWRRPLTSDERAELVAIAQQAGSTLSDFDSGLEYAIAAMLQSPNFLFRAELGQPDSADPTKVVYGGYEMASRLAFFLWDGPPDAELLDAAGSGALDTDKGVADQVTRMIASPLAKRGLESFVNDWLSLYLLDDLVKDTKVFTQISTEVGPDSRQETLLDFDHLAFDENGDFRDIFTTRDTYMNPKLASLYGVRAPSTTGFALGSWPADQPRRGLLGMISTLAEYAHPTTTSPTERGKFIREVLMCQTIPSPPANVNTALPEPAPGLATMRQRLAQHASDPFCASCHNRMDPLGLGLENFDGIGVYRTTENGVAIDPSGNLDGVPFQDAGGLAQDLHDDPSVSKCFARNMYRYAVGHVETKGEESELSRITSVFTGSGYHVLDLMREIAASPSFRLAGAPTAQN